jgi:hypothetical protein
MSELEQSPVALTEESASPMVMTPAPIVIDFPSDGGDPIRQFEEPATEEPAEAVQEEPQPEATDAEQEPAPDIDWDKLTANLTPEQVKNLIKSNPALKRSYDGELGSRLQQERQRIQREAAEAAIAAHETDIETLNDRWSKYQEIEQWRIDDPERYASEAENNAEYQQWKADLFRFRERVEARTKVRLKPAQADTVNRDAVWGEFNNAAVDEAKAIIRAEVPYYAALPESARTAIESAKYDPGNTNWFEDTIRQTVKGMDAYHEKRLKEAVAAARESARNEALAEANPDRQVQVNNPTRAARSAQEIIQDHAFNGFRNITRAELDAAYSERGIAS